MKLLATTLLMSLCAQPVFALSCMRPDVVRLYQNAVDSKENYYFIKGILMPDGPVNVPKDTGSNDRESAETHIRFVGSALTRSGFSTPFDREITLRLNCASVWCGSAPLDREIFAAVKLAGQYLELDIGPCGFDAVDASEKGEVRVLDCHVNGNCATDF